MKQGVSKDESMWNVMSKKEVLMTNQGVSEDESRSGQYKGSRRDKGENITHALSFAS